MLDDADPNAAPGDVVAVFDKQDQLLGHGFYNPRSQIALRMLRFGPEAIDGEFWRQKLGAAVALRRQTLRLDESTDAYRLVHAEGDGLSGLIVERYADHLVVEVFSLGIFRRVTELAGLLMRELAQAGDLTIRDVVVRADERVEQLEGFRLADAPPIDSALLHQAAPRESSRAGAHRSADDAKSVVTIRENGVTFRVDLRRGHKTGFFCDQRDNRAALAPFCRDASVLDICGYTGGFAIYAKLLGAAREVTSVDLDEEAVALAKQNANLNRVRIEHVHADAFPYMRQMATNRRQYDVVVLDPPKLIATRNDAVEGRQRYLDLNKLALSLVKSGGLLLTCSCSGLMSPADFLDVLRQAARITGRQVALLKLTGAAADHPVALDCPESAYLKAAWLRVL